MKFKKIAITFLLSLLMITSLISSTFAFSNGYEDILADALAEKKNEELVTIYLFYSESCPHCEKEQEYLVELAKKYPQTFQVIKYEVYNSFENYNKFLIATEILGIEANSVPLTIISDQYLQGFAEGIQDIEIENLILKYGKDILVSRTYDLPILGTITAKGASISLVAIILGLIDGFNPCAMWVLLFLINLLIGYGSKTKMRILGIAFLFSSGLVYFLSMLGMNLALSLVTIKLIRLLVALAAVILGAFNILKYVKERKQDSGCQVVDRKKRKKLYVKLDCLIKEPNIIIAVIGVMVLALSINIVELACSLGFPVVFAEILTINEINGYQRILYLVLYVIMYMLDDMIIFLIAVKTFSIKGISTKFTKYSHLIGGLLMVIVGLLLIIKPEWIMFNF